MQEEIKEPIEKTKEEIEKDMKEQIKEIDKEIDGIIIRRKKDKMIRKSKIKEVVE